MLLIHGRTTSTSITEEVAIVATFTKLVTQSARFELLKDGTVVYEEIVPIATESNVYGVIIRPSQNLFPGPGTYTLRFRDGGGGALAEGALTVTL